MNREQFFIDLKKAQSKLKATWENHPSLRGTLWITPNQTPHAFCPITFLYYFKTGAFVSPHNFLTAANRLGIDTEVVDELVKMADWDKSHKELDMVLGLNEKL